MGATKSRGNYVPLIKVAAINALARCTRYVDTHFVTPDVKSVMEALKTTKEGTEDASLPSLLDLVRLAGQGRPALASLPTDSPYYRKSQVTILYFALLHACMHTCGPGR